MTEKHKTIDPKDLGIIDPQDLVTLVDDPFGFKTLEISEAQENEELDLDLENEETIQSKMQNIAQAIAKENALAAVESHQAIPTEEEKASQLATQIAEDQALQKEEQEAQADENINNDLPKKPQPDENGNLDLTELQSCLEALLFIADRPLSADRLRQLLGPDFSPTIFNEALEALSNRYQSIHHGIELVEVAGGFQFRTKPGRANLARLLAKTQTQKLSTGAMETLAIVAYRQPVMKEEIDKVRGVDSSYFIHGLLDKKLIKISGRSELPGRPMLYATTQEFLELFGLKDLSSMPPLRELEQMLPTSQAMSSEEDPKTKELRRLVAQMKEDSTQLNYDPREDEKILRSIRERVQAIPTTTATIEEQKALEKQAELAAAATAQQPLG